MTNSLNKMTDNLPNFRLSDSFEDLIKMVKKDCDKYF